MRKRRTLPLSSCCAFRARIMIRPSRCTIGCSARTAGVMATVDDQSLYSSMLATAALRASAQLVGKISIIVVILVDSPHASHIQCVALIQQEIDWHAD